MTFLLLFHSGANANAVIASGGGPSDDEDIRHKKYLEWLRRKHKSKKERLLAEKKARYSIPTLPAEIPKKDQEIEFSPDTETLIRSVQAGIEQLHESVLQKKIIDAFYEKAAHQKFLAIQEELNLLKEQDDEEAFMMLT